MLTLIFVVPGLINVDHYRPQVIFYLQEKTGKQVQIGRVSIQQLEGQVCVHLADRKVNVSAGHLLVLDCGVLHDVEALEESALLLTISWQREKSGVSESFSSTQQHLDEEAVSRIDDEGGAPNVAMNPAGAGNEGRS